MIFQERQAPESSLTKVGEQIGGGSSRRERWNGPSKAGKAWGSAIPGPTERSPREFSGGMPEDSDRHGQSAASSLIVADEPPSTPRSSPHLSS